LKSTLGSLAGDGEIKTFSRADCTSTNSSNVNTILFEAKLRVESGGLTFKSTGGKLSLGPPSGGIIFAQPVANRASLIKTAENKQNTVSLLIRL
jgi:hypothetical protein